MNFLFGLFIIFISFSSFSNQEVSETKNPKTKKEIYQTLMKDLSSIGEFLEKKPNKEQILINKITNLLSWNKSSNGETIQLSSGVFAMLAPEKTYITDSFEKKNYEKIFDSDSFGTAFYYKNYVVTNYHMCRGLNTIIRDYQNNIYAVKVLSFDIKKDICVLSAPKGIKKQRNFYTYKTNGDPIYENKRSFDLKDKISSINKKNEKSKNDLSILKELNEELSSEERTYAQISGAYGEFFIYKIEKDTTKDDWSKDNSYLAYGSKCKGGVSGSPVTSKKGIIGLFWGAESTDAFNSRTNSFSFKRKPALLEKNPICYFIDISEVDKIIDDFESKK